MTLSTPTGTPTAEELEAERVRLMADFSITFNGRHYQYGRYRYRLLTDAVTHAQRERARISGAEVPPLPVAPAPNHAEYRLMTSRGVTYEDGFYRLGDFRYGRLADALEYAGIATGHA
ncbi:MAG TPA: hypothetical protein VM183_15745 [Burkholderiales bacterium]|nr:hypothetical protein [Burkholderiales bacterium]